MKICVYSTLLAFAPFIVAGEGNLRGDDKRDVNRILQDPLPPPFGEGTLDNMPPALENICDQYTDAEAHGLCIAYCEAKDCDDISHSTSPRADNKGVQKSCDNLMVKFMELTGQSPPCDGRCPCWDLSHLQALPPTDLNTCTIDYATQTAHAIQNVPLIGYTVYPFYYPITAGWRCATAGPHVDPSLGIVFTLTITLGEANTCYEQIRNYCTSI